MRLDHLLSREKWLRRLNRILGRASGEARAEAEVRNSGEAPQNNRQKAGYDLTEFLIETLYRFEGSARFFKRTLKTAQGRKTERRSQSKIQSRFRAIGTETKHSSLHSPKGSDPKVLGGRMKAQARSSDKERRVDARAPIADEGRDKLRKASGSRK